MQREVADPLDLALPLAAFGVSEIVDENMANAARVHAIESGKDARGRTLVAFGGAAPLHAARMAEKLGLDRVLVPSNAGVGSAVGFLRAPIAYEIVRSQLQRLDAFDADAANALLAAMRARPRRSCGAASREAPLTETRSAFMRYRGQGHEIAVPLPARPYRRRGCRRVAGGVRGAYRRLYSRVIPGVEVEVLSWVLLLSGPVPRRRRRRAGRAAAVTSRSRRAAAPVFDPDGADFVEVAIHERAALAPGRRDPRPGGHRRGRDLDRGQPQFRRPHRRLRLYRADPPRRQVSDRPLARPGRPAGSRRSSADDQVVADIGDAGRLAGDLLGLRSASMLSTLPASVTVRSRTDTSMSEASMNGFSVSRSQMSS